ncbi:hypothetical protein NODU109028_00355 [Nocardioides dubius]|uniref:Uncharacterized protein n=1 Tax=Nocardioides dubius TaxID=317019 RepID=A0ABN1U2D6_9ACTN
MLRLVGGLVLTGVLVVGCGEQQAAEPTSRAEDRTAQLDQRQMISEDAEVLSATPSPVASRGLPTCAEIGAALGERVSGWRMVEHQSLADLADADTEDSAGGESPDGEPDSAAAAEAGQAAAKVSGSGLRSCEWRSRPADEGDHGLVVSVQRADGQVRRTQVQGHVVDLPTVERAGGFVVADRRDLDLDAPLDADGASVVIGRTTVHIAAARIDGIAADAHLDLAAALGAALDVQQVVGH